MHVFQSKEKDRTKERKNNEREARRARSGIGGVAKMAALIAGALLITILIPKWTARAQQKGPTYTVLYSFSGPDGAQPFASLIQDTAGNLYGTTLSGGTYNNGVVFKLSPDGTETVLHHFTGGADGATPFADLIQDSAGNLYGTATNGGASGSGTVFEISPTGAFTVLHSFEGGADGIGPQGRLIQDSTGNLFGATFAGGASGYGVVFKLNPAGQETLLYTFTGTTDGGNPYAGLTRDNNGHFYGTATFGGPSSSFLCNGAHPACGVVFKLSLEGEERVLYQFLGQAGGGVPLGGVIRGKTGDIYGTTQTGGAFNASEECGKSEPPGCGVIFQLNPAGKEKVLHTFSGPNTCTEGGSDGAFSAAGVIQDAAGNLYGTTVFGGSCNDAGMIFKLTPSGEETQLYAFTGGVDGANPWAGLIQDSSSNLYGTASGGGSNGRGVVFKVTP
jgi:uncharacterized repeat protein (TIGR03803 family)